MGFCEQLAILLKNLTQLVYWLWADVPEGVSISKTCNVVATELKNMSWVP